jgi:large subunit ribosomal protein LP0
MKATLSTKEKKALYFKKLHQILEDYTKLFIVDIKHVSSKQIADIRKALRGQAVLLFGKKTMVRCCIHKFIEEHPGHPIEKVVDMIHGNIGLVFVNGDMSAVRETILANKVPAPARVGVVAHVDVIVPAGPTGCDPGQTSFFQALNIATKINKSQIEIINPVPLILAGQKVLPGQAALLDKLNIRPFSYGMVIKHVYDNGAIYDPVVLDLKESDVMGKFFNGVNKIAALSLAMGYPTLASLPHSLNNAFRKLVAIVIGEGMTYSFEKAEPFKAYLADPSAFAAPAATAAPAASDAPAAEEKKEEEEEEEDVDMSGGGLFGDDDDDW